MESGRSHGPDVAAGESGALLRLAIRPRSDSAQSARRA